MFKYYHLELQLLGYDFIDSDKGQFVKFYLANHREKTDQNHVGYSTIELFEPLADWKEIMRDDKFRPGCVFDVEGYFANYRFRVTKFVDFKTS